MEKIFLIIPFLILTSCNDLFNEVNLNEGEYPAEKDTLFDDGSNIEFPVLNDNIIYNLELLGKIWGFMKYHHPEIAEGNYNWDYELFRVLPEYLKAVDNEERASILYNWIDKYGEIPKCEGCKPTPSDAFLKPDLSWIENSNFSNKLKKKIIEIYNNRNQGEHYYVELAPEVGNPVFKHENEYSQMPYPDRGFRLLSLFRYWNIIKYFFPYKHLIGKEWDNVLNEYIPIFLNAKNELEYELTVLKLIAEINDTHANLWAGDNSIAEVRGNNFPTFRAEYIENKYVVTKYANKQYQNNGKLKIGDIITHINGKDVYSIIDSMKAYYPSSNKSVLLRDISRHLLRSTKDSIELRYISEGITKEDKIKLYHFKNILIPPSENKEKSYKKLDGNIGYISLGKIKNEDIPEIKKAFKFTKGLIIDIRNYPSDFVVFTLGSYFVSKPTPFVKFTKGNINNPGEFTFSEPLKIQSNGNSYGRKVVILVNEHTQSQAEYTAMAFKAGEQTTILGSQTAGADGNVSKFMLPGGLMTMFSGIGVYYPDGTETQRIGIVPDIVVKPTIDGIKQGKDEVLEKAIELIKN